jgi:hypothetical protein
MNDFKIDHHGSIVILFAQTDEARAWVDEHLPAERMTWGCHGTVIEPRYIADIMAGIADEGLTIDPDIAGDIAGTSSAAH